MVGKYSSSRLVNINVNIIIASVLSIFISSFPVYFLKMITEEMVLIALFSFLIDSIIDISVFAFLHFLVNLKHSKFLVAMDFALIQGHRFVLAILYFFVAVGMHLLLMYLGVDNVFSFIASYFFALVVTRVTHTIYGLRTGLFEER